MKIALFEVSHWYFPLYIKHPLDSGVDIVGRSDKTEAVRKQYSSQLGCRSYDNRRQLITDGKPEAIFIQFSK